MDALTFYGMSPKFSEIRVREGGKEGGIIESGSFECLTHASGGYQGPGCLH